MDNYEAAWKALTTSLLLLCQFKEVKISPQHLSSHLELLEMEYLIGDIGKLNEYRNKAQGIT